MSASTRFRIPQLSIQPDVDREGSRPTAICGSDLHLYDGYMHEMEEGDILGHEPMGEVVEVGSAVREAEEGDRVVVPFTISCGDCFFCKKGLYSLCDARTQTPEATPK